MGKWRLAIVCIFSLTITIGINQTKVDAEGAVRASAYSNLVLFVQFSDTPGNFMGSVEDVKKIVHNYTDTTFPKSLVRYVDAISYGKMHIETYLPQYDAQQETITPIILDKRRAEYEDDASAYSLEKDILDAVNGSDLKAEVSKYDLDLNDDSVVDNVTFICQGAEGERASVFYPHKSDYEGNEKLNEQRLQTVNVLNSETLLEEYGINSYGVIAHEFLHSLGYPDLYTETGEALVSRWDLMATSSNFMQYPLAYLRSSISGWLGYDEITPNTQEKEITLSPASSSSGKRLYVIKSPLSSTEFFALEYRKQGERHTEQLDVKIPGTGLVIYRINTKQPDLSNHHGKPYGVYVFREGETTVNGATAENLNNASFFSAEAGRTSFGSVDLSATIADNALVYSDGTNSGIRISDIGSAGDTISCKVSFTDFSKVELWDTNGTEPSVNNILSDYSEIVSLDIDGTGIPYMLYSKTPTDGWQSNIYVSKYEKGTWTQVGNGINENTSEAILQIYQQTPYVLCMSRDYEKQRLYQYTSAGWKMVKEWSSKVSGGYMQYRAMKATPQGLYIVSADGKTGSFQLNLDMWDGTKCYNIKNNIATEDLAYPQITVGGEDIYISYRKVTSVKETDCPVIYKVSGDCVNQMDLTTDNQAILGNIAPRIEAYGDNLFLATGDNQGVRVYQYNGSKWTQIKNSTKENGAITSSLSATMDIAIMDGVPVVQVINQENNKTNTQVYRYQRGEWVQEGNTIDTNISDSAELAIYDNRVYLAYLSESYPMLKSKELQISQEDVPGDGKVPLQEQNVKTPTNVVAKGIRYNQIRVTWNVDISVSGYEIYRATGSNRNYKKIKTITNNNTGVYVNGGLITGTRYYYKVMAYLDVGGKRFLSELSGYQSVKPMLSVTKVSLTAKKKQMKIKWKKVAGAHGYVIYQATKKKGKYKKIKTITKGSTVKYTKKKLKKRKRYYYKVKAYRKVGKKKVYSSYSKIVIKKTK